MARKERVIIYLHHAVEKLQKQRLEKVSDLLPVIHGSTNMFSHIWKIRTEAKRCLPVKGDSMLRYTERNNLAAFKWKAFELELKRNAPFIYEVLEALITTPKRRKNQTLIICICAAIMFKHRHSNMSLIHKLISCILLCGHCSKEVYTLMCIVLYIIYILCRHTRDCTL